MSRLNDALRNLGAKCTQSGTAFSGDTIDELINCIANHACFVPRITLGTPYIARYEGTTPIYRICGEQDITSFSSGVYTKEIEYDAADKQMVACGCSVSVNFGTSPQTSIITSGTYGDLKVEAGVTGGSGVHKVIFKATDIKQTPTASTGIMYYWYEYKAVT